MSSIMQRRAAPGFLNAVQFFFSLGLKRWWWHYQFGLKARIRFYEKMFRFTERDMPVPAALERLYRRAVTSKLPVQHVLADLLKETRAGVTFGVTLARWVPSSEAILIQAGEESGSSEVPKSFQRAAAIAEAGAKIKSIVVSELRMPAITVLGVIFQLVAVSFFMLPLIEQIQPDPEKWPLITSILFKAGSFVRNYWWVFLLLGTVSLVGLVRSLPVWSSNRRRWFDKHVFPFTLYRSYNAGGVMIALASLTAQGNPFTKSLPTLAAVSSNWLRDYLRRMERGIISSKPPGEALDVGLFSKDLAADIKDYDEAQSLNKVMEKLGEDAITDVQRYVTLIAGIAKALATGAAVGMILFVYAGIVFLVLSLSTPGAVPL